MRQKQNRGGMRKNWSHEEESILIATIARAIRSGGKVNDGLVEAAGLIGRTPSACAFRYYREIRRDDSRLDDVREAREAQLWSKIRTYPGVRG